MIKEFTAKIKITHQTVSNGTMTKNKLASCEP